MQSTYTFEIHNIGIIRTPYPQKFGIPRQSSLAKETLGIIELNDEFNHPDWVRDLDTFDYIWIQFIFHDNIADGYAPLVRPPRLGGNKKMGVFATRSPHRPNHIGLSLAKLVKIEYQPRLRIHVQGVDLLDGTPIIDIKPYLPYAEAKSHARGGFTDNRQELLTIKWHSLTQEALDHHPQKAYLIALIEQSLSQSPIPAYQDDPQRLYVMQIQDVEVSFRIENKTVLIIQIKPL